ncbi:MAG: prenyltransferase/squalene oxidase repeat-containing protein [Phycisphaerae bacterium]|nr:prenyltransferase/squalene oxidase repeat-containing protein [Phycisphaerae bacterium]
MPAPRPAADDRAASDLRRLREARVFAIVSAAVAALTIVPVVIFSLTSRRPAASPESAPTAALSPLPTSGPTSAPASMPASNPIESAGEGDEGFAAPPENGTATTQPERFMADVFAPSSAPIALPPPAPPPNPEDAKIADEPPAVRRLHATDFGATPATETAVDLGLQWLAAHQAPDGSWDAIDFQTRCPADDRCEQPAIRRTDWRCRAGLTGLCMLAFLGAGYSDRSGPFAERVTLAREWLLRQQQADGSFGVKDPLAGYNDALATLAIAELFAQTRDEALRLPLERAIARLALSQHPLGGWDYEPAPDNDRNDTSITAWCVQALQTAAGAGLSPPRETLVRAALHFARASQPDGQVWYADNGEGVRRSGGLVSQYRYGPAMSACALVSETLLGWRRDSAMFEQQRARLAQDLPSAARARGRDPSQLHSEYYWYYGTVAMFQIGGPAWDQWNGHLRDSILPEQERRMIDEKTRDHAYGSWPAFGTEWGKWGRFGGRVYSTAIAVLTLETYYRHTPAYLTGPLTLSADDWIAFLERATVREKRYALRALPELRWEIGEPPLVRLLRDADGETAMDAAVALLRIDSPIGGEVLESSRQALPPWGRARLDGAMEKLQALRRRTPVVARVVEYDELLKVAIVDAPGAYLGLELRRAADSNEVDESSEASSQPRIPMSLLRVTRRMSDSTRAVADWIGPPRGPFPQADERMIAN